ncbi:hypothetical protein RvY_08351 [Ramazzottius varieornatus]|uniref:Deoxynucleoside kinase domain-containing protein n=1 Tax=Ramazzottius varieornatus TaxID=947166 RepID=A0A1D1VEQ6_RAMVA|nr:hypothetical protein RvY_08351 [Ramazzottius varieornatus]
MAGVINPLLISFVSTLRFARRKALSFPYKKQRSYTLNSFPTTMSTFAVTEVNGDVSATSPDESGKVLSMFSESFPKQTHSTVLVEGNIGCGKAEFLNFFSNYPSTTILEEPIELWRNKDGKNLLDLMYKDPKANSFAFQQYVLDTMVDLHDQGLDKPVSLIERSFYSARYVFIENLRNNGMLTEEEYQKLEQQFHGYLQTRQNVTVDLMVYIRTSPEVAHERILRRGRKEELSITVEYLRQLHRCYEDWIVGRKYPLPAPVMVIDGDVSLDKVHEQLEGAKDKILFGWSKNAADEKDRTKAMV